MNIRIVFLLLLVSSVCRGQGDYRAYYDAAIAAYQEKNFEKFYKDIEEAGKIHPYHQGILYLRGKAAALTGRKDEAIQLLKKAILINASFPLEKVSDFDSIRDSNAFKDLVSLQREQWNPILHSDTAFLLKDRTLHTEGITYSSKQQRFYIGSIHKRKIVAAKADGSLKDFCQPGFEGMTSVLGIQVDVRRKSLWAASSPMDVMENFNASLPSIVFNFSLTGKLMGKFQAEKDGTFGDLIVSKKGAVYVSDSKNNEILKVDRNSKRLEVFFSSPEIWSLQGLAFSTDESFLFLADYIKGIFRLDMKTRELVHVKGNGDYSMKGIDGLYFYKNSLIAIQNGVSPHRVTRYHLDANLRDVKSASLIDRAQPSFNEPTLGVIVKDTFYYIANSQWSGYTEQHQLKPEDKLQDIVILKAELR